MAGVHQKYNIITCLCALKQNVPKIPRCWASLSGEVQESSGLDRTEAREKPGGAAGSKLNLAVFQWQNGGNYHARLVPKNLCKSCIFLLNVCDMNVKQNFTKNLKSRSKWSGKALHANVHAKLALVTNFLYISQYVWLLSRQMIV